MKSLGPRLAVLWDRFWFAPESSTNLAAARILFAAHALWILLSRSLPALSALPREFWITVPPSARWRYLVFEGHPSLEATLQALALLALLGALLGCWPRTSCFLAGLLLYHLAPLETLFWTPSPWAKGLTLSVLALLTLSTSPCGDALALCRSRASKDDATSSEYAWPLRLVQVFLCQTYLFVAWSRLVRAGASTLSPANMRDWLLLFNSDDELVVFEGPGTWLAARPALCFLAAAATLALQAGFSAALFARRTRPFLVAAALAFHGFMLFAMNLAFLETPLLLVFVDWEALRRQPRQGLTRGTLEGTLGPSPTAENVPR